MFVNLKTQPISIVGRHLIEKSFLLLASLSFTSLLVSQAVVAGDTSIGLLTSNKQAAAVTQFSEDFANNTGLENFRYGVFHRNVGMQEHGEEQQIWGDGNAVHGGSWKGDHNLNCGPPYSQRRIRSSADNFALDELVYLCKDHVMTSMGDVDGYSIVWMTPDRVFKAGAGTTVSWEVNVTDLGSRQWWEVSIIPAQTEFLATTQWLASVANIGLYHPDAVVIGNGPFAGDVNISVGGENRYSGWQPVCGDWGLDIYGCRFKMIRRTFSVTDNGNGTLSVDYGGMFTQTLAGQLPDTFEVYFKDHNYTPDKDGVPRGHTWHWDNIAIHKR